MTNHEELARRVETEEPSRELEFRIWMLLNAPEAILFFTSGGKPYVRTSPPTERGKILTHEGYDNAPLNYLTSVDAALSLVPEGWRAIVETGFSHCRLMHDTSEQNDVCGFASTPAQAITAAALRAIKENRHG